MREIQRIRNNNNGEKPSGTFSIFRVDGIERPATVLQTFKDAMITLLQNKRLDEDDPKWRQLLPEGIVAFEESLSEDDYAKFDYTSTLESLIDFVLDKDIRRWTWHSCQLHEQGFEVICQGEFSLHHINWVWYQGIPLKHLSIEYNNEIFGIPMDEDALDAVETKLENP